MDGVIGTTTNTTRRGTNPRCGYAPPRPSG